MRSLLPLLATLALCHSLEAAGATPKATRRMTLRDATQLALRNSADTAKFETTGTRLTELVNSPAPPAPRRTTRRRSSTPKRQPTPVVQQTPAPAKPRVVEVIRSNQREEVSFEENPEEGKK